MEQTAIQAGPPALGPQVSLPAPRKKNASPALTILKTMASLRITVVLFVLSIMLVFFGTLAQVDAGIWTIVKQYFRSAFVWVPLQIFVPRTTVVPGFFPFPGGWLLGGLLLINLLAAHAVRFKMSWKRSGILLIHGGLIVMMVSELVTGLLAIESKMALATGDTGTFLDASREVELAIVDSSKPNVDSVVVVPEHLLRQGGVIRNELLPFDVDVLEYMPNSMLKGFRGGAETAGHAVLASDGNYYTMAPLSEEVAVGSERDDFPSARIAFRAKGKNEKLASGLFSVWFYDKLQTMIFMQPMHFQPQRVAVDGKSYLVELRYKRTRLPFSVRLLEFRHDVYVGTNKPKNFSSRVELLDPGRKEKREVTISMNAPLRYAGETFYQSGVLPGDRGTVLQVVNNPGWLMPYISCFLVAIGMIIHFGLQLVKFLQRRMAL